MRSSPRASHHRYLRATNAIAAILLLLVQSVSSLALPALAQSSDPASLPPPQFLPPPPMPGSSEQDISLDVQHASSAIAKQEKTHVASGQPLPADRIQQLIQRLPKMSGEQKMLAFIIPEQSLVKPAIPGTTVEQTFPPKQAPPKKPTSSVLPLKILRVSHIGQIQDAKEFAITFSQPMVPISDLGTVNDASRLPVKITPQPNGNWQWMGCQTLVFQPVNANKRFPASTVYKGEVPAGTSSVLGGKLDKAARYSFTTPVVSVDQFYPENEDGATFDAKPVMLAIFNQDIDREQMLKSITARVKGSGTSYPLALVPKERLKDETPYGFATRVKDIRNQQWMAFEPKTHFPLDKEIDIRFGPGCPSAEGPLKTLDKKEFAFRTYGPLRLHRGTDNDIEALAWHSFEFSNVVDDKKFTQSMVHVAPAVTNFHAEVHGSYIQLSGDFKPRTKYTVTFDAKVQDAYGQTLGKPVTTSFVTGDLSPEIETPTKSITTIPSGLEPIYPFTAAGVPELKVTISRVRPSDWTAFSSSSMVARASSVIKTWHPIATKVISVGNVQKQIIVDLAPYLQNNSGHFIITASGAGNKTAKDYSFATWVQVTAIGADAYAAQNLLVVATDLNHGNPLKDASAQTLPSGPIEKTDANGVAHLPLSSGGALTKSAVVIKNGADSMILPSPVGWRALEDGTPSLEWFTATDRGLYRPGQTVYVKGWLRGMRLGSTDQYQIFNARASQVNWRVGVAGQQNIVAGTCTVDAAGGFSYSFVLPEHVSLGQGEISMTATSSGAHTYPGGSSANFEAYFANCYQVQTFRVQEYRRPEFKGHLTSSAGSSLFVGDATNITEAANYYAGGPLQNAPVSWRLNSSYTSYSPAGWSDYSFGSESCWWLPNADSDSTPSSNHTELSGFTDALGKDSIDLKVTKTKEPLPVSCTCDATVTDVNRKEWTATMALLLHPASVYVGIKPVSTFYQQGKPVDFNYVVTDLDGKVVPGRKVNVQLVNVDDRADMPESIDVASGDLQAKLSFPAPIKGGMYKIVATVTDDRDRKNETKVIAWIEKSQSSSKNKVEQQKLLLIPDHKTYKIGETAQININAPFPNAHGVLTVRKQGLCSTISIESDKSSFTIQLPITSDFYPQVQLQADLVGANYAYASGTATIDVPPFEKKLNLTVVPKQTELAPGSDTTLTVTFKDAAGKPIAGGQAALVVVDEALLALANYAWTDPINSFYPTRTNQVSDSHSREFIMLTTVPKRHVAKVHAPRSELAALPPPSALPPPPLPGAPDGADMAMGAALAPPPPPGPQASPFSLRKNFAELALFAPTIQTDANGQAVVKLHLPDSVTRYRIMAAATADDKFGSTEANLTARLPLMVKPSLPRFLNLGDKCELPVVLQNQTDAPMQVAIVARADNAKLRNDATTSDAIPPKDNCAGQSIEVPAHDRVEVRFPAETDGIGQAKFQFGAVSGEMADAAEISLPVIKPASFEAFAAYGQIDDGAQLQKIQPPEHALSDLGGLSVTTSSTAVQSLTDAYFYIKDYSYECSEQLSSRMLAMLSLKDVLSAFASVKQEDLKAYDEQIQNNLDTVLTRQREDGSFCLWSKSEAYRWPYLSIQVTRALLLAKEKGFAVPDGALKPALYYLSHIDQHLDRKMDARTKLSLRAYALYVLSICGKPEVSKAHQLLIAALESHRKKSADYNVAADFPNIMSLETAAWFVAVLAENSTLKGDQSTTLLKKYLTSSIEETSSTAQSTGHGYSQWDWMLFYSPRRESAAILDCLIRTEPENDLIAKLAKGLMANRIKGRWEGTQENAYILMALSEYFATYEKTTPEFDAQLWLGNTFVGDDKFVGRSTVSQNLTLPIAFLQQQGAQDLLINKSGAGRLYYRVGLDYVPDNFNLPAADYGFSVQRTFEAVDKTSDVHKDADGVWHFKAGATVRAKVTFSCLGGRYHVALADPLAAGTEPVNPELSGNRTLIPQKAVDDQAPPAVPPNFKGMPLSALPPPSPLPPPPLPGAPVVAEFQDESPWWTWSWFDHQDLRDHEAEAFAPLLNAGTYTYSYLVRATTSGAYIVPPCKAEEMYMPETFGRTATEHVVIE